jgi:hypothetical protein
MFVVRPDLLKIKVCQFVLAIELLIIVPVPLSQ